MKKNYKKYLPKFKNEEQEHEFWAKLSALDYFDAESVAFKDFFS
jgi:hypothetical protein